MGIQGLLPLLKSIQKHTELKKFAGETLGIDAYGWLHRGTISCAIELAQGKPTRKYVDYAMHRVRMVKHFGVTPYLVFDGDFLPSKAGTEASRAKRREESKKTGLELLKAGKPAQAHQELQKAIDVTPEMARNLIEELKKADIPYVVAPYEADSQLVYLERQGIINGIISEDSDLLVFGAKRLLTKLDQYGKCIEINRRDFCAVREISLTGWTDVEFRHMAIFSGCDYLPGVGNMGLKTAYRMIRKHKTPEKILRMLRLDGKFRVSENYLAEFKQAELTFLYQRVFCPVKQELVFLTEPDASLDIANLPFIGGPVEEGLARAVARGDVNPITKEPIVLATLPGRISPKRRASQMGPPTASTKAPGKPIDAYFKASSRIPLGEMDPNCFVVKPGQAASRAQNGLLPPVFPLPRPYIEGASPSAARPYVTASTATAPRLRRRATEPLNSLLGLPLNNNSSSQVRRQTLSPLSSLPIASELSGHGSSSRPLKKARLCEDLPSFPDSLDTPAKSKFFSATQPRQPQQSRQPRHSDGNALLGKSSFFSAQKPKSKRVDALLFSDDSIEEALRELPDIDTWSRRKSMPVPKSGALQIFDDNVVVNEEYPDAGTGGPDEVVANSDDVEVPASSPLQPVDRSQAQLTSTLSDTPIREALQQFSYTPQVARPTPAARGVRMAHGLPTPASSMQKQRSSQTSSSQTNTSRSFSGTPMLTPLQRIGNQALQRGKGPHVSSMSPKPALGTKKDTNRRTSYADLPVNPAFVPLPKVDVAEVESLNRACGSEDLIIPDSDEENDPDAINEGQTSNRLGLSRFLYQ